MAMHNFIATIIEEKNNAIIHKKLIVYICMCLVENGVAVTKYECNFKVKDGTAETITNAVSRFFEKCGINIEKL